MRDPFSWSIPIGRLFGIQVRIHLLFPFIALAFILRTTVSQTLPDGREVSPIAGTWADATVVMVLLFVSVLLHEFGHCFAATMTGGEAREVLLWPLGGLAAVDIPHQPRAHFLTALAGPLVNLFLCLVSALLLALVCDPACQPPWNPFWIPYREYADGSMTLTQWDGATFPTNSPAVLLLARLFSVNWILLLLNVLLVGFPLDGGRMLQAGLWPYVGYRQSMTYAVYAGFGVAVLVALAGLVKNDVMFVFLAYFIYVSSKQELINLETGGEDSLFGYDFSQGYTSLERDNPPDQPAEPKPKKMNFIQRWLHNRAQKKQQREQEQRQADEQRMDELLEKIQKYGKDSLTDEENRFLKKVADRYRNRQ